MSKKKRKHLTTAAQKESRDTAAVKRVDRNPTDGNPPLPTNYLAVISYDGSNYSGWQSQAGRSKTVQDTLEKAAKSVFKKDCFFDGSGRTDAGVHGRGQTVSFTMEGALPPEKVRTILNHVLPEDIRVRAVQEVPYGYHARYDAVGKTYVYRILVADEVDAFDSRHFHYESRNLDVEAMRRAARHFCGTKDFKNFCATGSNKKTTVRRLRSIEIKEFGWGQLEHTFFELRDHENFGNKAAGDAKNDAKDDAKTDAKNTYAGVDEAWMHFDDGVTDIDAHGIATWFAKQLVPAGFHATKAKHKPVRVLELRFTGDGFLYKMVRMIVAALLDVGRGRITTDAVPGLFTKKNRAKEAAPPNGLYLERVYYRRGAPPRMPHLKKLPSEAVREDFDLGLDEE